MSMNMEFEKKLPIPMEVKEMFPISSRVEYTVQKKTAELKRIFTGEDKRFLLIIGPCSADREDSVMEYITRLAAVQEKVEDNVQNADQDT